MIVACGHKNISLPASDILLKVDNAKSVENFLFQTKQALLWKFCHFNKKVVFVVTRNVVSRQLSSKLLLNSVLQNYNKTSHLSTDYINYISYKMVPEST